MSDPIRRLVAAGAPDADVAALAGAEGMRLLRASAIEHALAGRTTLEEVIEETGG